MSIEKALEKAGLTENKDEESLKRAHSKVEVRQDFENFEPLVIDNLAEAGLSQDYDNEQQKQIETFDWDSLKKLGFIVPNHTDLQVAEEFRSIKRPLVINALAGEERGIERPNLILITSSVPGEGKSFVSINLALSIAAERDKQVLLIDADVSKPSISQTLGIRRSPGLIEYLEGGKVDISDIILQTEIPGLRIIPAGKSHRFSTELLASNRMINFASELSERYSDRIVIFDSPPLLAATQAEVLSSLVGQIVLVIEAERTSQSLIMESVKKLESCDVVLTVLNKSQRSMDMNYYGYGQY